MLNYGLSLFFFFIAIILFFTKQTFLCLACLFLLFILAFGVLLSNGFDLHFIMLANIIVYLGAVVILLIIVIMLINEQSLPRKTFKKTFEFWMITLFVVVSKVQLETFEKYYQTYFLSEKILPANFYTVQTWTSNQTISIWALFETAGKYNFLLLGILLLISLWVSLHIVTNVVLSCPNQK